MEEREIDDGMMVKAAGRDDGDDFCDIVERVQSLILRKSETTRKGEEISWAKYGQWRQGQKTIAARLENQLKLRGELEELIEEELFGFCAHYSTATVPAQLKDIALLLMPKWTPPHELAALYWLGDWRPTAILDLIFGLAETSYLSDSGVIVERLLSQVVNDIRIEERIIDEELSEIRAKCVLHLPFGRKKRKQSGCSALSFIQKEFKKIERVITKAQQLRYKTLELVVKKVLSQPEAAAAFFVAFSNIQDVIHQVAEQQKPKAINVPAKTPPEVKRVIKEQLKSKVINVPAKTPPEAKKVGNSLVNQAIHDDPSEISSRKVGVMSLISCS